MAARGSRSAGLFKRSAGGGTADTAALSKHLDKLNALEAQRGPGGGAGAGARGGAGGGGGGGAGGDEAEGGEHDEGIDVGHDEDDDDVMEEDDYYQARLWCVCVCVWDVWDVWDVSFVLASCWS